MSSKVDIANLALSRLGSAKITSFDDNTVQADLLSSIYDDVVDDVLVEGPWPCAMKRRDLAELTDVPVYRYSHTFQLPTDPWCLKVEKINECREGSIAYSVEGRTILTDESTMSILYIARLTNSEDYDTLLKRAIVSRLVAEMAYTLTGDKTLVQKSWDKYRADVNSALSIATSQGSQEYTFAEDLLDVRRWG